MKTVTVTSPRNQTTLDKTHVRTHWDHWDLGFDRLAGVDAFKVYVGDDLLDRMHLVVPEHCLDGRRRAAFALDGHIDDGVAPALGIQ